MYTGSNSSASYKKGLDWPLVILYVLLVVFGLMNLYAANFNPEVGTQFSFSSEYFKQGVWVIVSLFCAGVIMLSDSKIFVEFSWIGYLGAVFLLLVVLFFGREVYGAKAWLTIGPVAFQPAEFAKIGTSLVLARMMSRYDFKFSLVNYVKLFGVILLPMAIIILQNDTGSALVYFVFLLAMFREGLTPHILLIGVCCLVAAVVSILLGDHVSLIAVSVVGLLVGSHLLFEHDGWRGVGRIVGFTVGSGAVVWGVSAFILGRLLPIEVVILAGWGGGSLFLLAQQIVKRIRGVWWLLAYLWIALGTSFATGYVFDNILGDHQRTRINVLFGIEDDPLGAGYNVNQSLIAIGSGGLTGKGYLDGTQTKLDFVPKQTTDFIFCTVGEEWGFLGCLFLVAVYVAFFLRILHLAEKQHSAFSRVFGYCVAGVFFFHFTINMCMTIGLMPVIGIPLPFFSYGGSSLWGFSVMLWIFLKLDTDRNFLIR